MSWLSLIHKTIDYVSFILIILLFVIVNIFYGCLLLYLIISYCYISHSQRFGNCKYGHFITITIGIEKGGRSPPDLHSRPKFIT